MAIRVALTHGQFAARAIGRGELTRSLGIAAEAEPAVTMGDATRSFRLAQRHIDQVRQAAAKASAEGATDPWTAGLKATEWRAKSLAVTETFRAASEERLRVAEDIAARYPVELYKEWNAQGEACPACVEMDGEIVGINESFSNGATPGSAHTNCCCWLDIHSRPVGAANDNARRARPEAVETLPAPVATRSPAPLPAPRQAAPPAPPKPPAPPPGGHGGPPNPPHPHSFEAWKEAGFQFYPEHLGQEGAHEQLQQAAESLFGKRIGVDQAQRMLGIGTVPDKPTEITAIVSGKSYIRIEAKYPGSDKSKLPPKVSREFRERNGVTNVHHEYFKVLDKYASDGVGKAVLRDQFREYANLNVKTADMTAAWAGRYTWPRMGFDFRYPEDMREARTNFVAWIGRQNLADREAMLLKANEAKTAHEFTRIFSAHGNVNKKTGQPESLYQTFVKSPEMGRKPLKNWMYDLGMKLEPGDPAYETAREYLKW